jgi:hypothetical protein
MCLVTMLIIIVIIIIIQYMLVGMVIRLLDAKTRNSDSIISKHSRLFLFSNAYRLALRPANPVPVQRQPENFITRA